MSGNLKEMSAMLHTNGSTEIENSNGKPQTPNEQWNYLFIVGVKQMCDKLMYGDYRAHNPKTDENIQNIVKTVVTTHQLYRTNCSNVLHSELKRLEGKFLGRYLYKGRLCGIRVSLELLSKVEPEKIITK